MVVYFFYNKLALIARLYSTVCYLFNLYRKMAISACLYLKVHYEN